MRALEKFEPGVAETLLVTLDADPSRLADATKSVSRGILVEAIERIKAGAPGFDSRTSKARIDLLCDVIAEIDAEQKTKD